MLKIYSTIFKKLLDEIIFYKVKFCVMKNSKIDQYPCLLFLEGATFYHLFNLT